MRYTNGAKIINVSKGAYKAIYKDMGFLPMDEVKKEEEERGMIEVTNGETTLLLQKKEYEQAYKDIGFLPVDEYEGGLRVKPAMTGEVEAAVTGEASEGGLRVEPAMTVRDTPLRELSQTKLKALAKEKGIPGYSQMPREALIKALSADG